MLEEGLRSSTFSPAEAAQGLLSFVRFELQDGGANAEKRFIGLFSLVCDRLFGTLTKDKEGFLRHENGGWLARQNRWESRVSNSPLPSSSRGASSSSNLSSSLDKDPVIQLLCGMEALKTKEKLPTFLEAMSGNTEARRGVRVQYPFHALPKSTQEALMSVIDLTLQSSSSPPLIRENAVRLFRTLLRVGPKDQVDLQRFRRRRQHDSSYVEYSNGPLSLSPRGGLMSPMLSLQKSQYDSSSNAKKVDTPQIMLNMVEYFLFTFLRYPLATPSLDNPTPQGRTSSSSSHHSGLRFGDTVYIHLFRCYLLHYLPHSTQEDQRNAGTSFVGFPAISNENELFLRIAIEFWLLGNLELMSTSKSAILFHERRQKTKNPTESTMTLKYLSDAYDLVKLTTKYEPPSSFVVVQKCLKYLVGHSLKDPLVPLAVRDCYEVSKSVNRASIDSKDSMPTLPWCISPVMTILQPSLYCHILMAFRYAPIHVSGSLFHAALDLWLLWLEPWNVEKRKKNASNAGNVFTNTIPHISSHQSSKDIQMVLRTAKANARSKYDSKWEPYVAANLYFYTVPLALFLRRARELDFSSRYFTRSFKIVLRVFRVYTPEVLSVICSSLDSGNSCMASLVKSHSDYLGPFSPVLPVGTMTTIHSMSDLQGDTKNLLEEIYMQYNKTVRDRGFLDRLEANIEAFFGSFGLAEPTAGEESQIRLLVAKATKIAGLPSDYQCVGAAPCRSIVDDNDGQRNFGPLLRTKSGTLTDEGRSRLIAGEIKSRPVDVVTRGVLQMDNFQKPATSYELSWLVPLTIELSNHLNLKFGFSVINLRFFADYRNLIFLCFASWIVIKALL
mmetsp:Transcript_179/g.242  ORF Transcript_179/g.242 Transcript_179/m.242 type:complete len:839 (-) Transcript_179:263-2779(-)